MTTAELFTTTVDAVGMEVSPAEDGSVILPFLLGAAIVLVFLAFAFEALRNALAGRWSAAREHADVVVVSGIVSALLCFPLTTDAFSAYGKNPMLLRTVSVPSHSNEDNPGPDSNTVIAAVHDQFQDELDNRSEGLKDMGLDKECQTYLSMAGSSRDSVSVLCGGYSLDPVITDKATFTPVIETSADEVWLPWFSDPHNVEVTASIEIDKK